MKSKFKLLYVLFTMFLICKNLAAQKSSVEYNGIKYNVNDYVITNGHAAICTKEMTKQGINAHIDAGLFGTIVGFLENRNDAVIIKWDNQIFRVYNDVTQMETTTEKKRLNSFESNVHLYYLTKVGINNKNNNSENQLQNNKSYTTNNNYNIRNVQKGTKRPPDDVILKFADNILAMRTKKYIRNSCKLTTWESAPWNRINYRFKFEYDGDSWLSNDIGYASFYIKPYLLKGINSLFIPDGDFELDGCNEIIYEKAYSHDALGNSFERIQLNEYLNENTKMDGFAFSNQNFGTEIEVYYDDNVKYTYNGNGEFSFEKLVTGVTTAVAIVALVREAGSTSSNSKNTKSSTTSSSGSSSSSSSTHSSSPSNYPSTSLSQPTYKYKVGDYVRNFTWGKGSGWEGVVVDKRDGNYQVELTKITVNGFATQINADICTGNKRLKWDDTKYQKVFIWISESCIE